MFRHYPLEALRLDSKNWGDQYCWYCQVPRFILGYGSANLDRFGALVNEVFKPRITAINGRLVKTEGILMCYIHSHVLYILWYQSAVAVIECSLVIRQLVF